MRALIVEDDPFMQLLLKRLTEERGHNVTVCSDARSALECYAQTFYPLLVLDWVMEGMNGLELCRRVRTMPHGDWSVIMAVTSRTAADDLRAVLDAGFDDYLAKPIDAKLFNIRLTIAEQRVLEIAKRKEAEENLKNTNEKLHQINERLKENQTQLVHSEKMASLGQLAAGIAHEINNPMGFISSNLTTLGEYIGTFKHALRLYKTLTETVVCNDEARRHQVLSQIQTSIEQEDMSFILNDIDMLLQESQDGAERVREIVLGLRSFARLDEADMQEVNINDGLEATLRMIWNELKYKCTVEKKLRPLPHIRCFPGQLNQVFMNLLVNAGQAIEHQGIITIETDATDTEVIVRISDTGVGIVPENISKLFNPFYTTKPVGKGTGLGLSISYGIIQKHNGHIEVESEVGRGTTFTVFLPLDPESIKEPYVYA